MPTTPLTETIAAKADACTTHAATARQQLADRIADGTTGLDLTTYLHNLITAETTAKVHTDALAMLPRGATTDTARAYLTDLLLQGPSDTWSGRGNDAERVKADAIRTAVRDLLYTLTD